MPRCAMRALRAWPSEADIDPIRYAFAGHATIAFSKAILTIARLATWETELTAFVFYASGLSQTF
jgi:hypothetical protein